MLHGTSTRLTGFVLYELSQSRSRLWASQGTKHAHTNLCVREGKPHKLLVPPTRPRHISAGWGRSRVAPGCGETGQGGGVASETPNLASRAGTPCVALRSPPSMETRVGVPAIWMVLKR